MWLAVVHLALSGYAESLCCYSSVVCVTASLMPTLRCSDCTVPTTYCGHGKCNVFGCNCDDGCRLGDSNMWCHQQPHCKSLNVTFLSPKHRLANVLTLTPLNESQFTALLGKHLPGVDAREEFTKLDIDSNGQISANEIDSDVPQYN